MSKLVRVIPAVLTENAQALKTMLQQAEAFTDYVQIDIMDGKFVPSHSITWEQIAEIQTKLQWEAHLMIKQPEKQLGYYQKAGARKVIFHFEATHTPGKLIAITRKLGLEVGLAVNPETPVPLILPFAGDIDSVLFLSVHPGFYGAKFIPEVLNKITVLREACPDMEIGIDGGIKEANIREIAKTGVNDIFVGSAIFLQPNPAEAYHKLQQIVKG